MRLAAAARATARNANRTRSVRSEDSYVGLVQYLQRRAKTLAQELDPQRPSRNGALSCENG